MTTNSMIKDKYETTKLNSLQKLLIEKILTIPLEFSSGYLACPIKALNLLARTPQELLPTIYPTYRRPNNYTLALTISFKTLINSVNLITDKIFQQLLYSNLILLYLPSEYVDQFTQRFSRNSKD